MSILSISGEAKLLLSNVLSFSKGAYISDFIRGDFSSLLTLSATKLSCLNTGFSSFFHSPCLLFSKGSGIGMSGMIYPPAFSVFSALLWELKSLTRGFLSGTCFTPMSGSKSFFLSALSTSWKTNLYMLSVSLNLTSSFAGCTFTSTSELSTLISRQVNGNLCCIRKDL